MNTLTDRAVAAYSNVGLETEVSDASPQRLVVMLYDGAIAAMHAAKAAMARRDIPGRGAALSKAIAIIEEGLRPALDLDAGGAIAVNLSDLYEYISNRLLYANLKEHEASLDEAIRLMSELRGAWEALERQSRAPQAPAKAQTPEPQRQAALSYGRV